MSLIGMFRRCFQPRRGAVLRESATLLLFVGSLAQLAFLRTAGTLAIDQFATQGYVLTNPVIIEPVSDTHVLSGVHGGGWAPGHIGLRPHPTGLFGPDHYLVHELAHEAVFQSCGVINPARNEALTLLLSGELHSALLEPGASAPSSDIAEMRALWEVSANRAPISPPAERALRRIAAPYAATPHKPCALPEQLEATLKGPAIASSADTLVISLLSGRTLLERGDVTTRRPLGSLLKIIYAGASRQRLTADTLTALARSDETLLTTSTDLDPERFRLLTTSLTVGSPSPQIDRSTMGFASGGDYPYQGDLHEIALALRAAILIQGRETWTPLAALTQDPTHTLHAAPAALRELLEQHHAWAKTGTLSLTDGTPVRGLLGLVWPQPNPTLLAVFSRSGVRGTHVLDNEISAVRELFTLLQPAEREASSSIMTALPPQSFGITAPRNSICQELPLPSGERATLCGAVEVTTHAPGAVPQRFFHGIIRNSQSHPLLSTDPYTFGTYVGVREAGGALPSVRDAIEAIAAWNGTMATHGHATGALCDTTHCMVQMGWPRPMLSPVPLDRLRFFPRAFEILGRVVRGNDTRWIEFSLDRTEPWERHVSRETLANVLHLPSATLPQRIRSKSGEIFFQIPTDHSPQLIPCDRFMTLLDLPSCPATATDSPADHHLTLTGTTIGHGRGFSIQRAVDQCGSTERCSSLLLLEDLLEGHLPR